MIKWLNYANLMAIYHKGNIFVLLLGGEMKSVALYFPDNMMLDFEAEGTTDIVWAGKISI